WFGALAVVVTFRQTDPLYTLDLSAPADPRLLGTLKIPGFSSYLHPVGDDLLLGLGQDASRSGRTRGAQAAVFDLTDLRDPRRTDTVAFARHTELAAAWDSRAFTYLPEQRIAVTTVQDVWNGRTRLAVLRVGSDGSLAATTTERLDRWSGPVRALPVGDRVALVSGGEVRLISV
ncbi:MAG TPA: beta-propeller domain-containing protein, partial [Nocardioidaceae bacterium]|nr:beta-propeller domain-containing protein [Nocardioidaceae bacterium]